MEVDEGGGGYGFARRNNPARKKVGRRAAVHSSAPVVPAGYAPSSQKPFWVWLLIGFLLGTGGTLLTASFWLPESGNRQIAALETDDGPAPDRDGVAAATVTEPPLPKEIPIERQAEPTAVAAPDIDSAAATPRVDEAPSDTVEVSEALPDRPQDAEEAADEAVSEVLLPNVVLDSSDAVEQLPVDRDRSTTLSDPGEALAALVSETTPTEITEPPSPADDRSPGAGSDLADRAERAPSAATKDPTVFDKSEDLPVVGRSDDEPVQEAPPRADAAEAATADNDLPPRIRQALGVARAESQSTTGTATESRRLYRVQLAAVDNEAAARVFWREVNQRLPGVFVDVEPIFSQRLVDERLFLRVWVGAFESRLDADSYCGWLKLKGQDCFVTRVDNL